MRIIDNVKVGRSKQLVCKLGVLIFGDRENTKSGGKEGKSWKFKQLICRFLISIFRNQLICKFQVLIFEE